MKKVVSPFFIPRESVIFASSGRLFDKKSLLHPLRCHPHSILLSAARLG